MVTNVAQAPVALHFGLSTTAREPDRAKGIRADLRDYLPHGMARASPRAGYRSAWKEEIASHDQQQ